VLSGYSTSFSHAISADVGAKLTEKTLKEPKFQKPLPGPRPKKPPVVDEKALLFGKYSS
jgi:hypothetical protein